MLDRTRLVLVFILLTAGIAAVHCTDYLKVVPAAEILEKIQKGEPVEYDHVIVKGDLNLSKLDLPNEHSN